MSPPPLAQLIAGVHKSRLFSISLVSSYFYESPSERSDRKNSYLSWPYCMLASECAECVMYDERQTRVMSHVVVVGGLIPPILHSAFTTRNKLLTSVILESTPINEKQTITLRYSREYTKKRETNYQPSLF